MKPRIPEVVVGPVESDIPVQGKNRRYKYPFHELEIGQSFCVRCHQIEKQRLMDSMTSCRWQAEQKFGGKFVIRTVNGGIRVWRTA